MPRLNDPTLTQHKLPTGHYGYSGVRIEQLGATEYTLATIVQDVSGSVSGYKTDMEKALKEIVVACKYSPRADNLLIRLLGFDDKLNEIHGFKLLEQCNPNDYDGCLTIGGTTALYDATENAVAATKNYAEQLIKNDFSVNAIIFVITDGMNNASALSANQVKKALAEIVSHEEVESIITVLIGVAMQQDPDAKLALQDFQKEVSITQFISLEKADAKSLAKLADFISKSISAQSQALGSGAASQPLSLYL
jgi:uncharacterized protein YegL